MRRASRPVRRASEATMPITITLQCFDIVGHQDQIKGHLGNGLRGHCVIRVLLLISYIPLLDSHWLPVKPLEHIHMYGATPLSLVLKQIPPLEHGSDRHGLTLLLPSVPSCGCPPTINIYKSKSIMKNCPV